jgi:hypothetical protein
VKTAPKKEKTKTQTNRGQNCPEHNPVIAARFPTLLIRLIPQALFRDGEASWVQFMVQTVPAIDLLFRRHILSSVMSWINSQATPDQF